MPIKAVATDIGEVTITCTCRKMVWNLPEHETNCLAYKPPAVIPKSNKNGNGCSKVCCILVILFTLISLGVSLYYIYMKYLVENGTIERIFDSNTFSSPLYNQINEIIVVERNAAFPTERYLTGLTEEEL